MNVRFQFSGTGGEFFVKFLVGMLLTIITFGIYLPWFMVNLTQYVYENTTLKTDKGDVRLSFNGTGGQLFVTYLVGSILTLLTIGIYGAWFMVNMAKFFCSNTTGQTTDNKSVSLEFNGSGGSLLGKLFVGYLLTMITFGIYAPWFMCNLNKYMLENTAIIENGQKIGGFDFVGKGGDLFVTYLVGFLLTIITVGIYGAWFAVKLFKFFTGNTEVTVHGEKFKGDFLGTGGDFFVLNLVGYLLTVLTMGIYGAWYYCKLVRFQLENTKFASRS